MSFFVLNSNLIIPPFTCYSRTTSVHSSLSFLSPPFESFLPFLQKFSLYLPRNTKFDRYLSLFHNFIVAQPFPRQKFRHTPCVKAYLQFQFRINGLLCSEEFCTLFQKNNIFEGRKPNCPSSPPLLAAPESPLSPLRPPSRPFS